MVCAQQFICCYKNSKKNIDYNPNMPTRYEKNMQIPMPIIDTALICGSQGIAFRTHETI